ncbi:MAG: transposase family protein, partial [Sulfitobacter sp.]|nr:transposase family protein [Sulfitobacter sp.]
MGLKVAITLKFLAIGDSYSSLRYSFRVAHNTISPVVRKVLGAIVDELMDEYIKIPMNEAEWKQVAQQFQDRWNVPNALEALDCKHVEVQKPPGSDSEYMNYKSYFSIVLMALVDSDYQFRWIDVGTSGGASDARIFLDSELREALED